MVSAQMLIDTAADARSFNFGRRAHIRCTYDLFLNWTLEIHMILILSVPPKHAATTTVFTLPSSENHKASFLEGTLRVQLIQNTKLPMPDPETKSTCLIQNSKTVKKRKYRVLICSL